MKQPPPGRFLAIFTVGFLLLDALLLIWLGVELSRGPLVAGGIACAVAAGVVILVWRRYRHVLDDISAQRREMKAEVEAIRHLLREKNHQN
jgi:membrane protein implicated in regulation of membrane protease activity